MTWFEHLRFGVCRLIRRLLGRKARVIYGHRAVVTINGQVIGELSNIRFRPYPPTPPPFVLGANNNPWLDHDFSKPITVTVTGWRVIENNLEKLDADQT